MNISRPRHSPVLLVGGSIAVPERLWGFVTHVLSPEADLIQLWSLSSRNCCREWARARQSRMAETIRRIAESAEIPRSSTRGGTLSVNRSFGGVDEGTPSRPAGS